MQIASRFLYQQDSWNGLCLRPYLPRSRWAWTCGVGVHWLILGQERSAHVNAHLSHPMRPFTSGPRQRPPVPRLAGCALSDARAVRRLPVWLRAVAVQPGERGGLLRPWRVCIGRCRREAGCAEGVGALLMTAS